MLSILRNHFLSPRLNIKESIVCVIGFHIFLSNIDILYFTAGYLQCFINFYFFYYLLNLSRTITPKIITYLQIFSYLHKSQVFVFNLFVYIFIYIKHKRRPFQFWWQCWYTITKYAHVHPCLHAPNNKIPL